MSTCVPPTEVSRRIQKGLVWNDEVVSGEGGFSSEGAQIQLQSRGR